MGNIAKIIQNFIITRRDMWPHWVILPVLIFFAILSASAYMTAAHPASGEIVQNTLIGIGIWVNYALFGSALLVFMAAMLHVSGKDITITFYPVAELGEGQKTAALPEYSIEPDVLIVRRAGETKDDYDARMDAAAKTSTPARWVVAIPFRSPLVSIFGTVTMTYNRDEKIFAMPDTWPGYDGRIAENGFFFTEETPEQYIEYVQRFVQIYREWSPRKKSELAAGKSGGPVLEILKSSANVLALFLLFSVAAFAQKSAKVAETKIGNSVPAAGVPVSYIFQKTDLYRTGNGQATYTELLKGVPGYRDNGGGELLAIMAGGKSVYKANQTGDVAEKPKTKAATMRSHSETVEPENLGNSDFSMPDSNRMREAANQVQIEFDRAGRQVVGAARPWFDTLNFIFMWLYPLLVLIGGVSYLWAFVSAKQGMYETHRASMRAFTWVALITATVVLINALVFAFSLNLHPIGLTIIAGLEVAVIVYATHKLSPDFRPSFGNNPNRGGAWRNQNNPELPA